MTTKRAKSLTKGKAKASRARRAKSRRAKASRRTAARDVDSFVDAAVRALDLKLEPAWKGAVKTNLEVTLALAALFADFPPSDDAELAPVFSA
jgi:1-carboxybiuret hydrolase subunit AtzG-like